uniref:Uncharacterized protein n=1 Tax=Cacopsylla melanoneura TaxID=428564 RepID=A0A8D8VRT4_9HEMI
MAAQAHSAADNSNYNAYLSKLARLQALKQKNYQSAASSGTSLPVQPASRLTSKHNSAAMFQNAIAPQTPPGVLLQQAVPAQAQAAPGPSPLDYDPFFSPILGKVDQIFTNLGVYDEPCRERLVCQMYRTPSKYSPHSNLVSNELSRDPAELPKTTKLSVPAVRFYKYVQAAREGQDNNECSKLYPTCAKTL